MDINPGDTFAVSREITDDLIRSFADISGDHNPIHLDEEFASSTRFGGRIAHGALSAAFISAVLGGEFSERKIVYLSQTMSFMAPAFIGDTITTTAVVISVRQDNGVVTLRTTCANQRGVITLDGEAVIMILQ